MEPTNDWSTYNFIDSSEYFYSFPKFNPLNPNEFVYFRRANNSTQESRLIKFNIANGKTTSVLNQVTNQHISWGVNDRILYYHDVSNSVKKIKSDKSDNTALLNNQNYSGFAWNAAGTKFIKSSFSHNPLLFDNDGLKIRDINFEEYGYTVDWQNNLVALVTNENKIKIHNLTTHETTTIDSIGSSNSSDPIQVGSLYQSLRIIDGKYILWNNSKWIARTNIETKEREILKVSSMFSNFHQLDVSMNNEKIIYSTTIASEIDSTTVVQTNHLFIMNIDGTEEKRILLPE